MTTPYGVGGCRCAVDSDGGEARWTTNPHCPYHGILPRDRTDTGVYRVVRGDDGKPTELEPVEGRVVAAWDADGEQVYEVTPEDPDSLDNRLRRGIEQHSCAHEGCTGEPGPDSVDHRLDEAAERVARISEGLNQRLAEGHHAVATLVCSCGNRWPCYDAALPGARDTVPGADGDPVAVPDVRQNGKGSALSAEEIGGLFAASAKHLASGALRPALTAEEEKYYWLIHKPAWWRRLFRR